MKKLIPISVLLPLFCSALGSNTCLRNNTAILTIRKSDNPKSLSYDNATKTFTLEFKNEHPVMPALNLTKISGAATCNNITTNTNEGTATQGDSNVYLRASNDDTGPQCWCSLTGPITSWWVYYGAFSNADTCATGCTAACANALKADTNGFRTKGVYLAIW